MSGPKALVFVPTYNERENAERIAAEILGLGLDLDILFLDDNSPDGTGKVLNRLAGEHANIYVIHRKGKLGVGSAHLDGIRWAYDRGYEALITMDCDFTHPPRYIPDFLASGSATVVVGSRYIRKDSLQGWDVFRLILTRLAHMTTSCLLKIPYDATSAYRLYRLERIPQKSFDLVRSKGYSFFFESLYILFLNGFAIDEVPITLPARTRGHSKMTFRDALQSVRQVLHLYFVTLFDKRRFQRKTKAWPVDDSVRDGAEWDDYWTRPKTRGRRLYGVVAAFYRRFIIKGALNHFIGKYFPLGAELLHAGCGSGEVDTGISRVMRITALDLSNRALQLYRKPNGNRSRLVRASVFQIPLKNEAMDGVYNLGVMEHFTEEEIHEILLEFHRVLRRGGKTVIFWPPEFGLSVAVLKVIHFMLNGVLRRNVRLHPVELTRARSKAHTFALLEKAGFEPVEYYFGLKDLLTHAVVVARKG